MDLFSHLIRLPKSFFDKNKEGDILHRINNEINTIQSIVTGSVFILDEATSGLDSDSEKMVFDKLVGIYQDKAMIFISHRISTVKNVDEIICMHNGKIVEKGGFEELVAKKGFYWKLFQNQIE
jgi:ABC-type multidrug transport system fused ATPase/permease subunit